MRGINLGLQGLRGAPVNVTVILPILSVTCHGRLHGHFCGHVEGHVEACRYSLKLVRESDLPYKNVYIYINKQRIARASNTFIQSAANAVASECSSCSRRSCAEDVAAQSGCAQTPCHIPYTSIRHLEAKHGLDHGHICVTPSKPQLLDASHLSLFHQAAHRQALESPP